MYAQSLNHVFMTPWMVAHQSPLSMEVFRQEYWSRLPFPTPGNLPHPGIKPKSLASPALLADSLPLCHLGSPEILCTTFFSSQIIKKMNNKKKSEKQ